MRECRVWKLGFFVEIIKTCKPKGYLRYKTIISKNESPEAQFKNFFYFLEKLCSILKIFKFLHF